MAAPTAFRPAPAVTRTPAVRWVPRPADSRTWWVVALGVWIECALSLGVARVIVP